MVDVDKKPIVPNLVTVTEQYFQLVDPDGRHAAELRGIIENNRKFTKYMPLVLAAATSGNPVAETFLAASSGMIAPGRTAEILRAIRRAIRPTRNGRKAAC